MLSFCLRACRRADGLSASRMHTSQKRESSPSEPNELRLWPGVVAVSVQWLCWIALPLAVPGPVTGIIAAVGGLGGGLAVAVVVGVPEPRAAA